MKNKADTLKSKFIQVFEEAYKKREGRFSIEEWRKFEDMLKKLPEKELESLKDIKGLTYLVNKILYTNKEKLHPHLQNK